MSNDLPIDQILRMKNRKCRNMCEAGRDHVEIIAYPYCIRIRVICVDDRDCIFSFEEDGIVRCSFQKAYLNGETTFRKPISCHLFPIRISGNNRNIIRYEEIYECEDALVKGEKEDVTVFEFAKESLEREYGENFYNELKLKFLKNS